METSSPPSAPAPAPAPVEDVENTKDTKDKPTKSCTPIPREKRHRTRHTQGFSTHIHKVLCTVSGKKMGIKKSAMNVMDDIVKYIYHEICREASKLRLIDRHQGITTQHLQSACELVFSNEISKHALIQGSRAVKQYLATKALAKAK